MFPLMDIFPTKWRQIYQHLLLMQEQAESNLTEPPAKMWAEDKVPQGSQGTLNCQWPRQPLKYTDTRRTLGTSLKNKNKN